MSQDNKAQSIGSSPFNVVVGGAGIGLLAAAAAVAYVRSRRHDNGLAESILHTPKGKPFEFNLKGKWALNTFIKVIEHDSSRKVLLAALKAMAKGSK